jgi:hypothetical protein
MLKLEGQKPKSQPNWDAFFVASTRSVAYSRIATQVARGKVLAVSRLEIVLGRRPLSPAQYNLVKTFWDDAVTGLLPPLSTAEVAELNKIATDNGMPFAIAATGMMQLT